SSRSSAGRRSRKVCSASCSLSSPCGAWRGSHPTGPASSWWPESSPSPSARYSDTLHSHAETVAPRITRPGPSHKKYSRVSLTSGGPGAVMVAISALHEGRFAMKYESRHSIAPVAFVVLLVLLVLLAAKRKYMTAEEAEGAVARPVFKLGDAIVKHER